MGTVLAFDFGEKRIGVATGETLLGSAHPLTVIRAESNDDRFAAIGKLIAEWQPERLVVGLPTHADGNADALFAEIEREDRAHAQACPATSDSCEKLMPSFCIAAGRRSSGGRSNRIPGWAGTVKHEFWASSSSSWPASQSA